MNEKWCVLSPVYNDWDCAEKLATELKGSFGKLNSPAIFFVNDGSTTDAPQLLHENLNSGGIISLTRNLGHQKAIAVGLSYIEAQNKFDFVVVLDSDGEDRPMDIPTLIEAHFSKSDPISKVIFAHRKRRHEGFIFKSLYLVYRILFQVMTGQSIAFGNFCLIPAQNLKKVVHISEIWNHFSGGIIRSRIPYTAVPVDRGKRYYGNSKMNFTALIIHGISSITVHLDVVAVRLLMSSALIVVIMLIGFCFILALPQLEIAGNLVLLLGLFSVVISLLMIVLFIALSLTFNVLFYRIQKPFIPAFEYEKFVSSIISLRD